MKEGRRLIAAGADVDYQSRAAKPRLEGKAALHVAAEMGHTALVPLLLRSGADPNLSTKDSSDSTALHLAARNGNTAVLEELLNANTIDVDAEDGQGFSPLQICIDQAAIATLLRAGADWRRRLANPDETVLDWATTRGHFGLVEQVVALQDTPIDD